MYMQHASCIESMSHLMQVSGKVTLPAQQTHTGCNTNAWTDFWPAMLCFVLCYILQTVAYCVKVTTAHFACSQALHCHNEDLPNETKAMYIANAGCVSVPAAKDMSDAIDGDNSTSWHLPLPPLNSASLEPYSPGKQAAIPAAPLNLLCLSTQIMITCLFHFDVSAYLHVNAKHI